MPGRGSAHETDPWVALLIWADSPVVRYRHAIAVGLETVQVFTVVTLSGRRVRSARYRPASEMLSWCAMSAGGVERGWAMEIRPDPARSTSVVGRSPLSRLLAQNGHPVDQTRVPQEAAAKQA
jgi:hypothetical protein